ncbi:hypothetical protein [Nonomuraea soli]|uniref:Putative membrane protein n=1 Tax=Nonomuraea soli TaxID=1032476 RepID=A0A7W0CRU5_9ACTN|nr:hypothetical protein [Nonomuraea soli]MBA2896173.1 putative membrane protein [Nonomuraea soli]
MTPALARAAKAGAALAVAAAVNVATSLITDDRAAGWWAAGGTLALALTGFGLQWWLTPRQGEQGEQGHRVTASGDGSIAAAGNITGVSTRVESTTSPRASQAVDPAPRTDARGTNAPTTGAPGTGASGTSGPTVSAPGRGAIAAGGDIEQARTEVRDS